MRRALIVLPIIAVVVGILVGAHGYIAQRIVIAPGLPAGLERALVCAIWTLAALIPLQAIVERTVRSRWSRIVVWPAVVWMGLFFYLILLVSLSDLLLFTVGLLSEDGLGGSGVGSTVSRWRAGLVAAGGFALALAGLRGGLSPPALKRFDVWLERWPAELDGFRIVQISDLHIGPILDGAFATHLVERVNALEPDLVAITGDLVDGPVTKIGAEVEPFANFEVPGGVFFVTGNHDHYSGDDAWAERVSELGIRVLRNERVRIGKNTEEGTDASFELAGVDDHRGGFEMGRGGEDLHAALADLPEGRAVVLLAHDPSTFKKARTMGIDLQISGHTHGGQIWPFRYFVRLVVPWVAGLYREGSAQLYVSRGTGFWGPPMRLFAPAEITEIRLRRGVAPAA